MNEALRKAESAFSELKRNIKSKNKNEGGNNSHFYNNIIAPLTINLKKLNINAEEINKYRKDYFEKYIKFLEDDMGRTENAIRVAKSYFRNAETDKDMYVMPSGNVNVNDIFFNKFKELKTIKQKRSFIIEFLNQRGLAGIKNSRAQIVKKFNENNMEKDKELFLKLVIKVSDSLKEEDGTLKDISRVLYNKYSKIKDSDKFAQKIVEEIPKMYGAKKLHYQNFTRWMNKYKGNHSLTKEREEAIKKEWQYIYGTETSGDELEKKVKSHNPQKQEVKITKGRIDWKGDNISKSSTDIIRKHIESPSIDNLRRNKLVTDNIINKIRNADFLKDDVMFTTENRPSDTIRIEVKNKAGTGRDIISKLKKPNNKEAETYTVKGVLWAAFARFDSKAKDGLKNDEYKNVSIKIQEAIEERIKDNRKWISNQVNQKAKKEINNMSENEKGKYLLFIGDIRSDNKNLGLRINLKEELHNIRFYVGKHYISKNNEYIYIDIKNVTNKHLFNFESGKSFLEEQKLIKNKLYNLKNLLLEGYNK